MPGVFFLSPSAAFYTQIVKSTVNDYQYDMVSS